MTASREGSTDGATTPSSLRRPRLLIVVTLAEVGGAQSYVAQLLPALLAEFDIAVAAHGDGPLRDCCASLGVTFVPLVHVRRALSAREDPLGLLELVRLFRTLRPDIVHLNSSKAGILGRLAAVPARVPARVFTAHGWAFKATSGLSAKIYLWADRLARRLTTTVICVSETELSAGLAAHTCRAGQTVVIPNAVDVASFAVPERRREPPVGLVSVGRLAEPKDFSTLIAAAALLPASPSVHVRIVGGGPLRAQLESEIAAHASQHTIELVGEVSAIRPELERADIFVLSSHSEGMPISVLEAMASGLPVVASAVGGLHEVVVEGETGTLVPPGDPAALARALEPLIREAALRARIGAQGRARAEERFDLPHFRAAHVALYRSLLSR